MKQSLRHQQAPPPRERGAGTVFLLLLTAFMLPFAVPAAAQQGSAGIDPQITSSGGELQQGGFGELFSTVGEPLASDSMGTNAVDDESTWIGFWQIIPNDTASGVYEEWAPAGNGSTGITTVAPNPFGESLQVYLRLESPGRVRLTAYDLLGREAQILIDGDREPGTTRVRWTPEGLEAGTYLLKLEVNGTEYPARTVQYVK